MSTIIWDPNRNFFVLPYIEHPVTWYGLLFAFGFLVGYFLMRHFFTSVITDPSRTLEERKLAAINLTDRLAFLVICATIIGARLGHVFFYGWSYYRRHPFNIFKVWEGGLASHGGVVGIIIALLIFWSWHKSLYPRLTFLTILDAIMIPAAFAAGCIRIGNFINQEITGIPTDLPWGIIFLHPLDGHARIAVHPVQLYESLFYFFVFFLMLLFWRRKQAVLGSGLLTGFFFLVIFSFRFLVEFLKVSESDFIDPNAALKMGQWLSIPFVILGAGVLMSCFLRQKQL